MEILTSLESYLPIEINLKKHILLDLPFIILLVYNWDLAKSQNSLQEFQRLIEEMSYGGGGLFSSKDLLKSIIGLKRKYVEVHNQYCVAVKVQDCCLGNPDLNPTLP